MFAKYAKVRDAAGMTDAKVAERAGILPTVISEWKRRSEQNKEAELTVQNMIRVAKALGCTLDDLIGGEEE